MSPVIDLRTRQTAVPKDQRSILDSVVEGCESLCAAASSLPLSIVREVHVVTLERHLVALGVLLADLRQHTPLSPKGAA